MIFWDGEIVSVRISTVSEYNDRELANENRQSSGTTQLPTTQPAESDVTQTGQEEGTPATGNTIIPAAQTTPTTTELDPKAQTTPAKKEDPNTPKLQATRDAGTGMKASDHPGLVVVGAVATGMAEKSLVYGSKNIPKAAGPAATGLGMFLAAYDFKNAKTDRERAQVAWAYSFGTAGAYGFGVLGGSAFGAISGGTIMDPRIRTGRYVIIRGQKGAPE